MSAVKKKTKEKVSAIALLENPPFEFERQYRAMEQSMKELAGQNFWLEPQIWQIEPAPNPIIKNKVARPSPEETRKKFELLMGGVKRTLPLAESIKHEMELGKLSDWKAAAAEGPKRLCGVCGDPRCPYSD